MKLSLAVILLSVGFSSAHAWAMDVRTSCGGLYKVTVASTASPDVANAASDILNHVLSVDIRSMQTTTSGTEYIASIRPGSAGDVENGLYLLGKRPGVSIACPEKKFAMDIGLGQGMSDITSCLFSFVGNSDYRSVYRSRIENVYRTGQAEPYVDERLFLEPDGAVSYLKLPAFTITLHSTDPLRGWVMPSLDAVWTYSADTKVTVSSRSADGRLETKVIDVSTCMK